ncbi:MAG: AmmeMemoRadiSam system protein A [Chloroflexi bacterium]|nr:AmmeMemoRadiSam system protein A [Chloroflexota bacterium]
MPLSDMDRQYLLKLAREAITYRLQGEELPPVDPEALPESLSHNGACFVTLTKRGELQGCIGSLEPRRLLVEDVRANAISAAFHDPRFPPMQEAELDTIRVELSILGTPEPLSYDGPDDLITQLRPGIDGVVLESGWNRATFLPQVWDKLSDPHQFLGQLCRKANLSADAYRKPGLNVYVYQVEKFKEGEKEAI